MLQKDQSVIALIIACPDAVSSATTVLTRRRTVYGKRTPLEDYPKHRRGGQGVISIQVNETQRRRRQRLRGWRRRSGDADHQRRHHDPHAREGNLHRCVTLRVCV